MELQLDDRQPVVEKCIGCKNINKMIVKGVEGDYCIVYLYPETKWRSGDCPMATHLKVEEKVSSAKKRAGQQKHKKKVKKR